MTATSAAYEMISRALAEEITFFEMEDWALTAFDTFGEPSDPQEHELTAGVLHQMQRFRDGLIDESGLRVALSNLVPAVRPIRVELSDPVATSGTVTPYVRPTRASIVIEAPSHAKALVRFA